MRLVVRHRTGTPSPTYTCVGGFNIFAMAMVNGVAQRSNRLQSAALNSRNFTGGAINDASHPQSIVFTSGCALYGVLFLVLYIAVEKFVAEPFSEHSAAHKGGAAAFPRRFHRPR